MKNWIIFGICGLFMMVGFGCSDNDRSIEPKDTTSMYLTEVDGDNVVNAAVDSGFCEHDKKAVSLFITSTNSEDGVRTAEAVVNTIMGLYNDAIAKENIRINKITLSSSNQVFINEDPIPEPIPFIMEGSCGGTVTINHTVANDVETMTFVADQFCDESMAANFEIDAKVELNGSGKFIIDYSDEYVTIDTLVINPGTTIKASGNILEDDIDMILNINIVSTISPIIEEHTDIRAMKMQMMVGLDTKISINVCEIIDNIANETLTLTGVINNRDIIESLISTTTANLIFTNADGSCDVSTPIPIIEHEYEGIIEGAVVATGAENTKLKIEVVTNNTYEVSVDTNGDGIYDYKAGCIVCDLGFASGMVPY